AEEYYEKYGVNPRWDLFGPPRFIDDDKIYEEAKAEAEREGYRERQVSDRLEENKSALAEAQAPGTTGGVQNSDELFDLGETALEVFEQFVPIDEEAPGDCRHIDGPINLQTDIEERFNEQRGIDFQKFLDQAQKLRDAHATLRELHETTESNLNSLYKDWTGPAANASYQKYSEDIAPNSNELLEYLEGGADVIEAAVQTVYEVCKSKIEQINDLYTPTVGSAVPDIARKVMTLARGEVEDQEQILEVAAWVDAETGSNIEATIRADDCGLNEENKVMTVNQCKEWVQTSWNTDLYDHLYKDFTRICDDAKEKVDEAWGELNEYFKGYTSEFPEGGDLGLEGPDTGNPDSGQRTPTGGGGGGGGGGTSPSTSTPPPIPEPDLPGSGQPKNPVTGEDLEIDPETGEPYPIDPETGEAIKDLGSDRDTLTVEKGDRTFEMTEPDEDGEMEISIDDGSGEPKEYKLDFGDGETGEGEAGDDDFGPRGPGVSRTSGSIVPVPTARSTSRTGTSRSPLSVRRVRMGRRRSPWTTAHLLPPPTPSGRRRTRMPVPQAAVVRAARAAVVRTAEVREPCLPRARTRWTTRRTTPTRTFPPAVPGEARVAPQLAAAVASAVRCPEAPVDPPSV